MKSKPIKKTKQDKVKDVIQSHLRLESEEDDLISSSTSWERIFGKNDGVQINYLLSNFSMCLFKVYFLHLVRALMMLDCHRNGAH